jgi:hypothetical protein
MEITTLLVIIVIIALLVLGAVITMRLRGAKSNPSTSTESSNPAPTATEIPTDPFTQRQHLIEQGDYIQGAANIASPPVRDPFAARMARKAEPDFAQSLEEPGYPPQPAPPLPSITAFVSYRRKASAILATFLARELSLKGIDAFVDTRAVDGAGPFPERLLRNIEEREVFVCLLGEDTLESEWVRREIAHAHSIGKPMIPIFQESYVAKPDTPDEHVAALLQNQGVHILDIRNIYVDEAIQQLTRMIQGTPKHI